MEPEKYKQELRSKNLLAGPSPSQKRGGGDGQSAETSVTRQFHFSQAVNTLSAFLGLFQVWLVSQSPWPQSALSALQN